MAILALADRRTTNPSFIPAINRAHPLTRNLANYFLLRTAKAQYDYASGKASSVATSTTAASPQATPYGIGLLGSNPATRWVDVNVLQQTGAPAFSLIMGIYPYSATTAGAIEERIWDNATTDNSFPNITRGPTANLYTYRSGRSTSIGTVTISRAVVANAVEYHCVTNDFSETDTSAELTNNKLKWYINGVKQTVSVTANGSGNTAEPAVVRLLGINAASRGFDGVMLYWGKYTRCLSDDECRSITTNPWQIFQAKDMLYLNAAAAAGGGFFSRYYYDMTGKANSV